MLLIGLIVRPTIDAVQRAADMIDSFRNTTTAVGNTQEDDEDDDVNNKGMINIEDHGDDFAMTEAMKQDIASWDVASEYVKSLGPLFARRVTQLPGRDWYRLRRLLEVAYTIIAKEFESIGNGTSEMTMDEREKKIFQVLLRKKCTLVYVWVVYLILDTM
jgi:tRNA dimethylallyltransferase